MSGMPSEIVCANLTGQVTERQDCVVPLLPGQERLSKTLHTLVKDVSQLPELEEDLLHAAACNIHSVCQEEITQIRNCLTPLVANIGTACDDAPFDALSFALQSVGTNDPDAFFRHFAVTETALEYLHLHFKRSYFRLASEPSRRNSAIGDLYRRCLCIAWRCTPRGAQSEF